MAESSLSITYDELRTEIGHFLSVGSTPSEWNADTVALVARIIKRGLRQFYIPPLLGREDLPHKWSFLEPTTTLSISADDYDYDLPDGFGSMRGTIISYAAAEGGQPIKLIGEAELRRLRQQTDSSGKPLYAAVRPVYDSTLDSEGQRWELIFWPTPDGNYTLSYSYLVNPDVINATTNIYPLGGMAHGEAILESCLDIAELGSDDEIGIHHAKFMERLAASVGYDRRQGPTFLGYNGDKSIEPTWRTRDLTVSVNGVDLW